MRNKYKNLQNRGQSQKGSSFVIPDKRNPVLSENSTNYINRNSFVSNLERRDFDNKLFNKNNDKNKKPITINKDVKNEKKNNVNNLQTKFNNNNTIRTSNHNILISVYKKESSINKESSTNLNKNMIKTRIENNNINNIKESKNNLNNNNTISKNSHRNSKRITFNNRQSQNSNQNMNEKNREYSNLKRNKNQNKENKDNKDKKQLEVIEIKSDINNNHKNKISIINYRRKKNFEGFINNINSAESERETKINKLKDKDKDKEKSKQELNTKKINNFNNEKFHNYNSTSNIPTLNKPGFFSNTYNNTNSNTTTTERNNQDKKRLLNFRKIRKKDYNSNDEKSLKSPTKYDIISPNIINFSSGVVKRKMSYRSKRISYNNINKENKELTELKNENNNKINKDNNENDLNIFRKRKYLIKVTKTPNESNINKNMENEAKTEDINVNKKKIRHFLYYKSNKEKEEKNKGDEKEKNINIEANLSPKNAKNTTLNHSEKNNSPKMTFKKIKNRICKISPKHSFKDLLHEANQNKNLHDSFSNIFESCKNDINVKNESKNEDLNNSFTCFSNELELNLDNKNPLFNYINSSNLSNKINNSKNNIITSNINKYKNNSSTRNKNTNTNLNSNSLSNIIYRKKMNLTKSISNYYKKNKGILSPRFLFNSHISPNIRKKSDKISIKSDKKVKTSYEYSSNLTNNIINNNTYNTTLNIFKLNDISSKDNLSSNNIVVTKLKKDKKQKISRQIERQDEGQENIEKKNRKHIRTNSDFQEIKPSLLINVLNENNNNITQRESNKNIINNINPRELINNNSNINQRELIKISNDYVNNNNIKKNKSNSCSDLSDNINNNSQKINDNNDFSKDGYYKINLEILYILESKIQNILNKINIYTACPEECFDLITYYFSSKFYEKEIKIFKVKNNIKNISYYIKLELLCYFLFYDVCFNKSFSQTGILLKTIFNLLHNNFLILISFILNDPLNHENNNNIEYLPKLKTILKNNLKINITSQDYNETNILTLIGNNLKEVNTYYKMIIDNLYSHFYTKKNTKKNFNDIKYKFPHCLQLDLNELDYYEKLNIISLFFFDTYRLLNNYNFEDLKYFFDSFLQRIKFNKQKKTEKRNKTPKNKISNSNDLDMKSIIIYKYNYNNGNFYYLPPIKKYYKYTLVLDLDETLVYLMPNNIYLKEESKTGEAKHTLIFRPGLIDFLKKMKPLYELVVFSFGTYEYVDSVIKIIEKNEKFFEYVLYRQHATVNNCEYIKDLSLLGRDLKNIIIVDDIPQVFKMQERNGICIKAFYGDIVTERNTLKILGKILEKVRFDADEDGDIRKSLDKQRNLIYTHISNNID